MIWAFFFILILRISIVFHCYVYQFYYCWDGIVIVITQRKVSSIDWSSDIFFFMAPRSWWPFRGKTQGSLINIPFLGHLLWWSSAHFYPVCEVWDIQAIPFAFYSVLFLLLNVIKIAVWTWLYCKMICSWMRIVMHKAWNCNIHFWLVVCEVFGPYKFGLIMWQMRKLGWIITVY